MVLSMAAVAAVSVAAVVTFKRAPVLAVVWFGYLAALAPYFGLTEKPHMTSDRYGCLVTVIEAAVLAAVVARIASPKARAWAVAAALAVVAVLGFMTHRQLRVWTDDRVQHAYVAANLTNRELLDDFQSRQLILEFLRGNEAEATEAVAARLKADPDIPGFRKAAVIIAGKQKMKGYFGSATYLEILQEQMGLGFAREGSLREANDHLADALSGDDRFYQAAYDRSLVLLDLGRPEDALGCFLQADRWAPSGLPSIQRHAFLARLRDAAKAQRKPGLAHAADHALAR
jgi:tetratricopeptide (TPR) repeat protein